MTPKELNKKVVIKGEIHKKDKISNLIRDKRIVLLLLAGLFSSGFSVGISNWIPLYIQTTLETDIVLSGMPVTMLYLGIIVSRIVSSFISENKKILKLFFLSNLFGAMLWATAIIVNNTTAIFVTSIVVGILVGGSIPIAIAAACNLFSSRAGAVSSILIVSCNVGCILIPGVGGVISQFVSLWFGIFALCLMPLLVSLCFFAVYSAR